MRVETGDCNARTRESSGAHRGIRELQCAQDAFLLICEATSASGICEVTRAFQSPSSTLNSLLEPDHISRKADLVVIDGVREPHGILVEWRKADASARPSRAIVSA
jgi:hypothetical protein